MRKHIKKQVLQLIHLLYQAHNTILKEAEQKEDSVIQEILMMCQESAIKIGKTIELEEEDSKAVSWLEEYCERIYLLSLKTDDYFFIKKEMKFLRKRLIDTENYIVNNFSTSYEVVFIPYKASMWTALESIWEAAANDPNCVAIVMPIPYYFTGTQNMCYEGLLYPPNVPITRYDEYDLEQKHPDMIFIHNPYDNCNNLTTVPSDYYSSCLKQYTDLLIYSPYFTLGSFKMGASDFHYTMPGMMNADIILTQSKRAKDIFITYGHPKNKVLDLGSPKIDAIVNCCKERYQIPEKWKEKLEGKKVFLLNTHLSYFAKCFNLKKTHENYAKKYFSEITKEYFNRTDCALIWRPHPLMSAFLKVNCYEAYEYMKSLEEQIEMSSNCVIDNTSDYRLAFSLSSAMISTWSSLINEYMITGKPILIFQRKQSEQELEAVMIRRNLNYFRVGNKGISFGKFRDMIISEQDPMYQIRADMLKDVFANMDGSAGKKTYEYLCNL